MGRAKFQREGEVLGDRTRTDHTTFIHGPGPKDATGELIAKIERGDYSSLSILLFVRRC